MPGPAKRRRAKSTRRTRVPSFLDEGEKAANDDINETKARAGRIIECTRPERDEQGVEARILISAIGSSKLAIGIRAKEISDSPGQECAVIVASGHLHPGPSTEGQIIFCLKGENVIQL